MRVTFMKPRASWWNRETSYRGVYTTARGALTACLLAFAWTATIGGAGAREAKPPRPTLAMPAAGAVMLEDSFWAPRIRACREVTLPHAYRVCEETGRIRNFRRAAGALDGAFEGLHFNDSDVYKVVEGAEWALALGSDEDIERRTDEVVAAIAAAQDPSGYLDTYFTIDRKDERFLHIHPGARHELYSMGHAIEAGATRYELSGKTDLLKVARRLADHVATVFGPGKRREVPEHQEIELALVKLHRVTGEGKYLELARFFLEERGNAEGHSLYGPYAQDHLPIRDQWEVVGHAVRAMYNLIAAVEVYVETGDAELLAAARRLWESTTWRKMYVTGGVGSLPQGEAFGADYELPNATAYAETCAQIGLALLAHRLLLVAPDAEYADVLERVLYNGFLSGLSLSGDRFFYRNLLASDGGYRRRPWYDCACCPSNVVRLLPRVGQLSYAVSDESVWVHLYAAGTAKLSVDGEPFTLDVRTRYPWDGAVRLEVDPGQERELALHLRIPGWSRSAETPGSLYRWEPSTSRPWSITVNGRRVDAGPLERGYAVLRRPWKRGDVVELRFAMPVIRVRSHPLVAANRGRVALQRGPLVYCLEAVDHAAPLSEIVLEKTGEVVPELRADLLGGVIVLRGQGRLRSSGSPVDLLAVPYCAWDNREGGDMLVWIPEDPERAGPWKTESWIGANYTPAYSTNQIQMWHDFRPEVIERELSAARAHLGITTVRVFLHNLVHEAGPEALLDRIDRFLGICEKRGIRPGFVFFDDCHRREGMTLEPLPPVKGWHNGRWAACPQARDRNAESLGKLRSYVEDVVRAHAGDKRVLWWEVYNEPDLRSEFSLRLRREAYAWALQLEPVQPVLACWDDNPQTDIVDAHNYSADFAAWDRQADLNPEKGCLFTEAGARWYAGRASSGEPCEVIHWLGARRSAGRYVPGVCLAWELLVGDSNCRWYWGTEPGAPEPAVPWCGLLWPDGSPVSLAEAESIRRHATGGSRALLFEDFEEGSPLRLPMGWTAYGSSRRSSGVLELPASLKVLAGETSWRDYVLEARVMLRGTEGNAGVLVRANDPGPGADELRGYYVGFDTETLYAGEMHPGWRSIATFDLRELECAVEPEVWNLLRVEVRGTRIRVWFNRMHHDDGLRLDVRDDESPVASGAIGLRTYRVGAWFDNVVVLPLQDPREEHSP